MLIALDRRVWRGSVVLLGLFAILCFFSRSAAAVIFIVFLGHLSFFRDPAPQLPASESAVLSPASGKIISLTTEREDRYLQQEAVKIGVFLSIFNEHVNRAPVRGKVGYLEYVPGKFINALNPLSAKLNESNWIGLEDGGRRVLVRQISGAIARRIHCDVHKNEVLATGQKLGIICYGSGVEIFIPKESFTPTVHLGQGIHVGKTILGEWK